MKIDKRNQILYFTIIVTNLHLKCFLNVILITYFLSSFLKVVGIKSTDIELLKGIY